MAVGAITINGDGVLIIWLVNIVLVFCFLFFGTYLVKMLKITCLPQVHKAGKLIFIQIVHLIIHACCG